MYMKKNFGEKWTSFFFIQYLESELTYTFFGRTFLSGHSTTENSWKLSCIIGRERQCSFAYIYTLVCVSYCGYIYVCMYIQTV